MKYRVGDIIKCYVYTRPSGMKAVLSNGSIKNTKTETDLFQVIYIDKTSETYTILVPNNMLGWIISVWHELYMGIPKAFLSCKFWEVTENYIIGKN